MPPLTVWLGSAMYTFPVDRDVIVGRDRECDIRFQDIDPDDLDSDLAGACDSAV